jgi:hypothetical protein
MFSVSTKPFVLRLYCVVEGETIKLQLRNLRVILSAFLLSIEHAFRECSICVQRPNSFARD